MMQLVCNGEYLDLYENTELQFTDANPLFAFDDIACERTTQLSLPKTPKNDRIFTLSRIPAYSGEGMRRRFEAQLQDSCVVRDGYLYVSEYDGKDYKAIFITGELLGLLQLRDAGKIKEYWKPAGGIVWSVGNIKDANTSAGQENFAITRYVTNVQLPHPSFDLADVIQDAYNALTGRSLAQRTRGYRIIPREVQGMPKTSVTFKYTGTGADFADEPEEASFANTLSQSGALSAIDISTDTVLLVGVGGTRIQEKYIRVRQFVARQTIILTMPETFPSNMFLLSIEDKGGGGEDPEYNWLSPNWFLGDWRFYAKTGGGTATVGTPLAGKSVTVPRGTRFVFLSSDDYEYAPSPLNWDGFRYISSRNYTFTMAVEAESPTEGDTIRSYDMLPDLTLVELLKMYTSIEGKMLYYTEKDGITFDALDVSSWGVLEVSDKVIKRGSVSRKFGDYGQQNIIEFESGTEVLENQRLQLSYAIDNDNLKAENVLSKIPYSEGQVAEADGAIVARFDAEDKEKNVLYENAIMVAKGTTSTAPRYGTRVELKKNAGLQALCDASTQYAVDVRMTLFEYNQVTPKTLIQLDGTQYVWTSRTWKKDVASLTLAKIV